MNVTFDNKTRELYDTYLHDPSCEHNLNYDPFLYGIIKASSHFATIWAEGKHDKDIPVEGVTPNDPIEVALQPVSLAYAHAIINSYPQFSEGTIEWACRLGAALALPAEHSDLEDRAAICNMSRGYATEDFIAINDEMEEVVRMAGGDPKDYETQAQWALGYIAARGALDHQSPERKVSSRKRSKHVEEVLRYVRGYHARWGADF